METLLKTMDEIQVDKWKQDGPVVEVILQTRILADKRCEEMEA